MTNDKREQARILREIGEGWKANGITTGVDACLNGAAALLREAEAATAPDVSEAERPKRLCDYDPVETTVGDMVMRFGFDYTNFKFFAESITKLTAALRAARKREGEAVDALESIRDEVLHAYANVLDNGQVNYVLGIIDSHIAARETAALNEGAKNG